MAKSSKHSCSPGNESRPPKKRFDFSTDDDFVELSRGFVLKETASDTKKCVKLINDWACTRNTLSISTDSVPDGILLSDDLQQLSKWLCKFSTKARKQNGEQYPPKTIQHYLLGLQRHIRAEKGNAINFTTDTSSCTFANCLMPFTTGLMLISLVLIDNNDKEGVYVFC